MEILHPALTQLFFLILGAVISIATLMLTLHYRLRKDMSALRTEVKGDISDLRKEVKGDMEKMEKNFSELRKEVYSLGQRLAKLEGLFLPTPERVRPPKSA